MSSTKPKCLISTALRVDHVFHIKFSALIRQVSWSSYLGVRYGCLGNIKFLLLNTLQELTCQEHNS